MREKAGNIASREHKLRPCRTFIISPCGVHGFPANLLIWQHLPRSGTAQPHPSFRLRSMRFRFHLTLADVRACQRLRYEVFNAELGEGLESSHSQRLDRDKFDVICDHLMVRETVSLQVVGTYRMQAGYREKGNAGYYSEEFFEFTPYECIRGPILELGRACIHRDHRDSTVLLFLRTDILRYAQRCTLSHGLQFPDVARSRRRLRSLSPTATGLPSAVCVQNRTPPRTSCPGVKR
jgi:hypothetical protein